MFIGHLLRSTDLTLSGPSGDRYRFAAERLLYSCLDMTVLYSEELTDEQPEDNQRVTARILARHSSGLTQSYPHRNE